MRGFDADIFLSVNAGDFVVINKSLSSEGDYELNWWMGQVLFVQGGARDPSHNSLFQVADVDTGFVRWVNADLIITVLRPALSSEFIQ